MDVVFTTWTVVPTPRWLPFGHDVRRWVTTYHLVGGRLAAMAEKL